jgi:translation initiation factor IF-1
MITDPKKVIRVKGKVLETLPGTKFKVLLKFGEKEYSIFAYISGKMRMNYIKLQVGDEVDVDVSPYDLTKGRIIYRY